MKAAMFVLVVLGGFAVGLAVWLVPTWKLRSAFADSKLREYEERFAPYAGTPAESEILPPRRGKVLVLSQSTWSTGALVLPRAKIDATHLRNYREIDPPRLHESMYRLDPAVRASSPEEVGMVILCQSGIQKVSEAPQPKPSARGPLGSWRERDPGRQAYVILDMFDARSRRRLGTVRLDGNQPVQRNGKVVIDPRPDVAAFISRLPVATP